MFKEKVENFIKTYGGKIFYWIVVAGFIYFIARQFEDIEKSGANLAKGNLWYIGIAILIQVLYYLFMAQLGKRYLAMVGVEYNYWKMFGIMVSQFFMSISMPGGMAGSMAYRVRGIAAETNSNLGSTFVGLILMTLSQYWAFLLMALGTMWFTVNTGFEYAAMTSAIFLFMILCGVIAGAFYLMLEYPSKLLKLIEMIPYVKRYLINMASKLKGSPRAESWLEEKIIEVNQAARLFVSHKYSFLFLILSGLMLHVIEIALLIYVFAAFAVPFDPSLIFVVYTSLFLFSVVSLTPQGIGVVETAALVVFLAFGVGKNESILVISSFRAITVWIPILIGGIAFRLTRRRRKIPKVVDLKKD